MARVAPFESVLIANRGEIAVRIARTCRELDVRSIAVYSDADDGALHTQVCDMAVGIGGVAPRDSYLRIDKIIMAAKRAAAKAIHPGYGFLSENSGFARACQDAGIVFVGPPADAMQAVGDKISAKKTAVSLGVPVVPGYTDRDQSHERLAAEAARIGEPLLIKAAAGGGGRGMRLVDDLATFPNALESAQREALAAFGDATVFLERYLAHPRHIEIQILADNHGSIAALGERECSIQRRYQKILEEAPSTAIDAGQRAELERAAVSIAGAVGYQNAGTVEFMLDDDGSYYFLEMNARLQVEHPVTEMVTGADIVREQLWIAAGRALEPATASAPPTGHAIEVRIYAEDPAAGFLPSTGRITSFAQPSCDGVRNDVAVTSGSVVSAAYDPMIGKLIAHGSTRNEAIARLRRSLDDYIVGGVTTNIPFLRWLTEQPDFSLGRTHTDFLDRHPYHDQLTTGDRDLALLAAGAASVSLAATEGNSQATGLGAWQRLGAWRQTASPRVVTLSSSSFGEQASLPIEIHWSFEQLAWIVRAEGADARVRALGDGVFSIDARDRHQKFAAWRGTGSVSVSLGGAVSTFRLPSPPQATSAPSHGHGAAGEAGLVEAPMSGTIVKINVKPQDEVTALETLVVMEAMKMEHSVVAPYAGTVVAVEAKVGQIVASGDTLITLAQG